MSKENLVDLTKQTKIMRKNLQKVKFSHLRLDIFQRDLRCLKLHAGCGLT